MKDLLLKDKDELIHMIFLEHLRQIKKWGIQDHTSFKWLACLPEEVGELSEAILYCEHHNDKELRENVVKEAIQIATLSLKIAEMFMHKEA